LENNYIKIDDSEIFFLNEDSNLETKKKSEFSCGVNYLSLDSMSELSQKIIESDNLKGKIDFYFETLIVDLKFNDEEWLLTSKNGDKFKSKYLICSTNLLLHKRSLKILNINQIPLRKAIPINFDKKIDLFLNFLEGQSFIPRLTFLIYTNENYSYKDFYSKKQRYFYLRKNLENKYKFERIIFQQQDNNKLGIVVHTKNIEFINSYINAKNEEVFKQKIITNFNNLFEDNSLVNKLNFDEIREIALETKPKLIICGYSAYPRTIDFESFRKIADEVGAFLMADIAHIAGLVASKLHPNPIPYCDVVTTTTHKTLRGPRGGLILCKDAEFGKKFDKSVFPGTQGGPLEHIIAAKAVAFGEALQPDFVNYSQQVIKNAKVLASTLINRGIDIVSGGTDNHIVLLDLRSINMTGKIADLLVSEVNITANKNTVPFDPESPFVTSGLRLGTAALTTRGFNENAFAEVGEIIADRLLNPNDSLIESQCKERVLTLCNRFPLYEGKLEASIK